MTQGNAYPYPTFTSIETLATVSKFDSVLFSVMEEHFLLAGLYSPNVHDMNDGLGLGGSLPPLNFPALPFISHD